jgi:predicted GIY-YIG superfamily endonuclease
MPDWSKGKIYKVTCCETGNVYIGSTTISLKHRFTCHNTPSNQCETRDFINPKIELIEDYPCETKDELCWREREWMEKTDCVNKQRPIVTREEKRERKFETNKKYHEENRDTINEKFNCECGGRFTRQNKAPHLKTQKHIKFISTGLV